jgi:hypothetical protein
VPSNVPPSLVREREIRAWDLACRGRSQVAIAADLGITQSAVSLETEVEARKAVHTARLEYIVSEALDAWAESKKPRQKSRSRKTVIPVNLAAAAENQPLVGGASVPVREEVLKEAVTMVGDVSYLSVALQADAELRKLHGINAPKRFDVSHRVRPLEQHSDEELARIRAKQQALLDADAGGDA